MKKVAGVGNALIDVFAEATDEQVAEAGLTKGTIHSVTLDEWRGYFKKFATSFTSPGGPMLNGLSTLSSLGLECHLVTSIGNDSFGTMLQEHFDGLNINVENANILSSDVTGRALVLLTPDHYRTLVIHFGAGAHLAGKNVSMQAMLDCNVLILEGYLVKYDSARDAISRGIEISHMQDMISVLTLADSGIVDTYRDLYNGYLNKHVDIMFGNIDEFQVLYEVASVEEVVDACKDRDTLSIITRGAEASVLCQKGNVVEVPPISAKKILDRTGAGDQFLAGFLAAYMRGAQLAPAGRFGSVLGSAVIEQISGVFHRDIKDVIARTM